MASHKDGNCICWQCSEFSQVFPMVMCAIKDLKEKRKRSDEDTILEKVSADIKDFRDKNDINHIIVYAADMGYLNKSHYGNHNTFNINKELNDGKECSLCGEKIVSFDCQDFNVNVSPTFVNVECFEQLAKEVHELKRLLNENVASINKISHSDNVAIDNSRHVLLEQEIARLRSESMCKDQIITSLKEQLVLTNKTISQEQANTHANQWDNPQLNSWERVARKNFKPRAYNKNREKVNEIPVNNRFDGILIEDDYDFETFNNRHYNDDVNMITNNFDSNSQNNKFSGILAGKSVNFKEHRRPQVVTQNILVKDDQRRTTIPGNSSYANVTEKGKKTLIIGASIVRNIDIVEFNHHLERGNAIKRSYGGSTTADMHWHITPTLIEEKPDRVVLNIGTNNLTKKRHQTEEEICQDIFNIAEKCRSYGVNEVYISGLTLRPSFASKVEKINDILRRNSGLKNYTFIDNTNITRSHLARDNLHLNRQGTILLANIFLFNLNSISARSNRY